MRNVKENLLNSNPPSGKFDSKCVASATIVTATQIREHLRSWSERKPHPDSVINSHQRELRIFEKIEQAYDLTPPKYAVIRSAVPVVKQLYVLY
jgi:hypothetical protein